MMLLGGLAGTLPTATHDQRAAVKFNLQYWHYVESPDVFGPDYQIRFSDLLDVTDGFDEGELKGPLAAFNFRS